MYYTQLLRAKCGLTWLTCVLLGLFVLVVATVAANHGFRQHGSPGSGIPWPALFAISGFVAAGFASRYARTLSEENEAHLPVVWTLPVSRLRYALGVIGIDVAAMFTAFAVTLGTIVAFFAVFGAARFIIITPDSWIQLARYLALPLAYYGVLTALTASFGKTGRGLIGFGWCASFLLALLSLAPFPRPWNVIFSTLNLVNPMRYADYSAKSGADTVNIVSSGSTAQALAVSVDFTALAILAVAGLAAGLWQWRRLEA